MFERSELQKGLERNNKCPRCNKLIFFAHTYEFGGQKRRTVTNPKDPAAIAECPRCHRRWFFFERPVTFEILEGERTTEVAFTEDMILDNSKGATPLMRNRSISREWAKTISLESERTDTKQAKFGLSSQGISLESMAEQAIRSKYARSEEQSQTFTDDLQFEVPPGTKRRVVLTFNHNWQHGKLVLVKPEDDPVEIPYRIVDGLTLDVAQEDEPVVQPQRT